MTLPAGVIMPGSYRVHIVCEATTELAFIKNKRDEMKYFLEQIRATIATPQYVQFNLSAFLSAGRSVTYIMQKVCAHVPDFGTWYKAQQDAMKKDEVSCFLFDKRLETVHFKPLL